MSTRPIPVDARAADGGRPTATSSGAPSASTASGTVTLPPSTEDIELTAVSTTFGGQARNYLLGVPRDYDPSRTYPLVMLFHGNPGTRERMRKDAPFEVASRRAAILVYPSAAEGGAWDLYEPTATNKDMSFVRSLPAEVARSYNVDPSRVFGFGFSGGAFLMAQMGCRFGQSAFRAVSIHSGGGPNESRAGFAQRADECFVCPGGPLPTLVIHGDADGQVVKESGAFTARCVAETNGCSDFPKTSVAPSPCFAAPGCQKTVEWCLVPNLGHALWDRGMQTAWDFFRAS